MVSGDTIGSENCYFPFVYEEKTYTHGIIQGGSVWCSTDSIYRENWEYIQGNIIQCGTIVVQSTFLYQLCLYDFSKVKWYFRFVLLHNYLKRKRTFHFSKLSITKSNMVTIHKYIY